MAMGEWPGARSLALALLYSAGAHGIMTLNDFKSIKGDRQMGIDSLPVMLGASGAAYVAAIVMATPQLVVALLLWHWGQGWHGLAVAGLLAAQLLMMKRFVAQPLERAIWYSGAGVPLYVSGMLISAFALRGAGA
jgi:chlorophyll synthase